MYLNNHTYYSLRYGAYSEKTMLELAQEWGVRTLALTDVNNTSACLNFMRLAPQFGVRPVVGIDFRRGAHQLYVALARNNAGFMELNRFLSAHTQHDLELPETPPAFENAFVIYPYRSLHGQPYRILQPNERIGVSIKDLTRVRFDKRYKPDQMVVLQSATFRNKRDFNAHRLLRAIGNNTLLSKLSPDQQADPDDLFLPPDQLLTYFEAYPEIIRNTEDLLEQCEVRFDFSDQRKPQNQQTYTGSARDDMQLLEQLCREGLPYRYGSTPGEAILQRLDMELSVIEKMGFVSYFLINWDIIRYAQRNNYFYVGRGSGANSIVAYLLRITDVDPIDLDLYFERFINLYRINPPDFDIDFSWRDRDDVTRYIFERFDHTALLATYNTFKQRAVVRELGKVFGLPPHEIDRISAGKFNPKELDNLGKLVLQYGQLIQGMPNLLSVHASGILISEKPIHYFTATDLPPKGYPTTQFDMLIAEDVGLYKFDILAQRGLAKIKEALAVVQGNRPEEELIDIHNIPPLKTDPAINKAISEARCMGCFYVESPAMRMLLRKLEVDNYLGLVAASSIIRPGVAQSGMMREYILRHKNPERIKDAHPVMLDIMPDTYGVMVYQEDVIKVAHHFAGLSLGEADVLRRGMSGKYRSREEFMKVREKYFVNCFERGYTHELAAEVWRQIESFAGYAFAKGHSASYAIESYQSLYLKVHYPLEFMVAVLNNGGGFYRPEIYIHEARMQGGVIHAPCVNRSEKMTIIRGDAIFLGLHFIKDLEVVTMNHLIASRDQEGEFQDLNDFMDRVPVGIEQMDKLIRVGAMRFTGVNKRELLWHAHLYLNKTAVKVKQQGLFKPTVTKFSMPGLPSTELEDLFDQIELLGFPLGDPFKMMAHWDDSLLNTASMMEQNLGSRITLLGYLVTAKNTATIRGDRMYFGTFLDRVGQVFDTTHFPPVASRYPFRGVGIYRITGKVVEEFDFLSIEVERMVKEDYVPDPRYSDDDAETRHRYSSANDT
ncbi:MAG: DNA polymerase III subunit alpha [Flavobacteriales bacterium]|nr:DNA polymerase III subunit alpha [Bacteroidota bacterium]MCB9240475.1 DNA polymerase III subunit alpha [Flavobacteriales bacterium]